MTPQTTPLMKELLEALYGAESKTISDRLTVLDSKHWPNTVGVKDIRMYVTYPDAFCDNGRCTLRELTEQLVRIKKFHFNTLHILPFLQSPMIDMGFDVSDYYTVREELGGNEALDGLLDEAKKLGIDVFMDLVLNHTSRNHEWFQKAVAGEEKFQNYYLHWPTKPELVRRYSDEGKVIADYLLDGVAYSARVIFPEQAGELPHFIEGADGNWYYHTFYPHQPDLDWRNPEVFAEMAAVVLHWAKKGLHFRFDAIPFVGKDLPTQTTESSDTTHMILTLLKLIVTQNYPACRFLVEASQPIHLVKNYFGSPEKPEADLAYNFRLTQGLWGSLLGENADWIWEALEETMIKPPACWVTFLRNHDELTLSHSNSALKQEVVSHLNEEALKFTRGNAVYGRTFDLLNKDKNRLIMAYCLLFAVPGFPAVIYGDEFAKENDTAFMLQQLTQKQNKTADTQIKADWREINRGTVAIDTTNANSAVMDTFEKVLAVRENYSLIGTSMPERINLINKSVFGCYYSTPKGKLAIWINLSRKTIDIDEITPGVEILAINACLKKERLTMDPFGVMWMETD